MRPVILEIDGFVSFRDRATIDFTDADYFALIGPTGAGKSTIVDAITFALYGSVHRWDNPHLVKYALAPTANRATVRLVFDVGPTRYVAAREVRRSGASILHKSRLERLADPSGTGAPDEVAEVLAADSGVTRAVEVLLGLTFDQFCTCVVLPQGDFAEFLHASRSDRQKILLRLLGAEHYDAIARSANSRAADARQRFDVLTGELAAYADATEKAEDSAAARERALTMLEHRVTSELLPELIVASQEFATAQRDRDRLEAERRLLADVTVPADAAELDQNLTAAMRTRAHTAAVEKEAQDADTSAREQLATAPSRSPLEQARRDHAEHARVTAALPDAQHIAAETAAALETAMAETRAAMDALEKARSARDDAGNAAQAAAETTERLRQEHARLAAMAIPPGLADLGERARAASEVLQQAALALKEAEMADARARDAVESAPSRAPLEKALENLTELAELQGRLPALVTNRDTVAEDHYHAANAVSTAEDQLALAREMKEAAGRTHQAAALREHLVSGGSCPVCEQTVRELPPPLYAPALTEADSAVKFAERALRDARSAEKDVADRLRQAQTEHDRLADRLTALRAALAEAPADADATRAALAERDKLEQDARTADLALRSERENRDNAQAQVQAVEQAMTDARTHLRTARDPMVQLGAPAVDDTDLLAAWTQLVEWARAAAGERTAHLAQSEQNAARLAAALREAQQQFKTAEQEAARRLVNERQATADRERAAAELTTLQEQLATLTEVLKTAPGDAEAQEALAELDALQSAARACDEKLRQARAAREQAEGAIRELEGRVTAAAQQLRATRDPLVGLGAPDLPADGLLTAWTTLVEWAHGQARQRADTLPQALAEAAAANERRDKLTRQLSDELTQYDVSVSDGDLTSTARPAVAAAVARARGARERLAERRENAARLERERAATETERLVAKTLGDLLSANNFQRWLAGSALDTLLIDASASLMALSGEQFELTHDDGELVVVDHADADSQRPVKTLSGGETFQASLALALALSAQMSTLAANGAVQLDSILLDEGFGTLDGETLEAVASTLDNLAHGDRMVGVITHVPALAERVPVRFAVSRDERTSTVVREAV